MTIALVAVRFFSGNIVLSLIFLVERGYLPRISASRFDLSVGAKIIGDKAVNHKQIEDDLASVGIQFAPLRKKNSKRAISGCEAYLRSIDHKYVETVDSLITWRFPKSIHAVTAAGFELKILLFVLAYCIDCL